jgi:hypothetical protein
VADEMHRNARPEQILGERGVGAVHSTVLVESPGYDDPGSLIS